MSTASNCYASPSSIFSCISPSFRLSLYRNVGEDVITVASKECFGLSDMGMEYISFHGGETLSTIISAIGWTFYYGDPLSSAV